MKFLPIASLALVLALSGCSSSEPEISPQEKRNRFDLCVTNQISTALRQKGTIFEASERLRAEKLCGYLLR